MTAFGLMTVAGGRLSGKLSQRINPRKILAFGLLLAVSANGLIYFFGQHIWRLVIGVGLLGLGFILIAGPVVATQLTPSTNTP